MRAKHLTAVIIVVAVVAVIGFLAGLSLLAPATFAQITSGVIVNLGLSEDYQNANITQVVTNHTPYLGQKIRVSGYLVLDGNMIAGIEDYRGNVIRIWMENPNMRYSRGATIEGTLGQSLRDNQYVPTLDVDRIR